MNLEAKILAPLNLRISHHGCTILGSEDHKEDLPLTPGAMIGGEHFGFSLIVDKNGKQTETLYPTQCQLIAVEIKDGILNVYESNKYISWKFDRTGNLVEVAQFDKNWGPDTRFLNNQGIVGEENIGQVNGQTYRKR